MLTKYSIPVFGHAPSESFIFHESWLIQFFLYGTHLLEYSLVAESVVSIGHILATALAATSISHDSITASVSGYTVIQGLTDALVTVLPSAWTSNQQSATTSWTLGPRGWVGLSNLCALCHVNWLRNHHSCHSLRISCSKSAGQEPASHWPRLTAYVPEYGSTSIQFLSSSIKSLGWLPSSHLSTLGVTRLSKYGFDIYLFCLSAS